MVKRIVFFDSYCTRTGFHGFVNGYQIQKGGEEESLLFTFKFDNAVDFFNFREDLELIRAFAFGTDKMDHIIDYGRFMNYISAQGGTFDETHRVIVDR